LLVEDTPEAQELITLVLADSFDVDVADTFDGALTLTAGSTYDVFLLDINLRGPRNGTDLARLLNDDPAHADTPKIAWTAYALPGDKERLLHSGFTHYLSKPTRRAELLKLLDEVLAA